MIQNKKFTRDIAENYVSISLVSNVLVLEAKKKNIAEITCEIILYSQLLIIQRTIHQ